MTAPDIAPWLAFVLVVVGWAYSAGQLAGILKRLTDVVDKLADKVDDHEGRLSYMEGREQAPRDD